MNARQERISGEFLSTLASLVSGAGEAGLERGYALGRQAMESDLGLLDISEAYVNALVRLLRPVSPESARLVDSTRELLLTSLAPFEMTHRGYQDSIEKLAAMNEELEAFNASVSHDLRAPARSMGGFARILLEDHSTALSEEARRLLLRIEASASRMERLIEALLQLARLGKQSLRLTPVNLTQLSQEISAELGAATPSREVRWVIGDGLACKGDRELLRIVLGNLLANAFKFTSGASAPLIEVGRIPYDRGSAFFVRDNGAGFDMSHAARLFVPFQRLHSATQFEGIGIGLATARKIVERHGGRIWAEGGIGRGATFYFTLEP